MPRRVLAKKITRKQAESYERTVPNPMGVTTLAAVNGPGAYADRYEATRALLGKPTKRKRKASAKKRRKASANKAKRKTTTAKSKTTRKASSKRRSNRSSSMPKASTRRSTRRKSTRRKSTTRRSPSAKRKTSARKRKAHGTVYKRDFIAEQMARGRSRKQAESTWKLARGGGKKKRATPNKRKKKASSKRKTQRRTYGKGKYKALRARVGNKSRHTYMYRTKKGNLRKIPKHGYLGYRSAAEMRAAHRRSPRKADKDAERWERAIRRRERASIRAVEGKSMFTPNRRRRSADITYEDWEQEMKANRRRRKKTTRKRRKSSSKKRRTTRRNASTRRRKTTRRKASTKRRTTRRKASTKRRPTRRKATTRRRRKSGSTSKRRRTTRRKTTSRKRRTARRNPRRRRVTQVAANRRRRRKTSSRKRRSYAKNRRRKTSSRKRRKSSRKRKRSYIRNQARSFTKNLMQVLKIGGVVVVGYLGHRALTRVLSDQVIGKVQALSTGGMAPYKDVVSGAIVAAVGVPLAAKFAPKDAKMIGAGMAASFLQNAIVTVLSQMGQTEVVAYLGDYTEAEGSPQYSGMGSYYEFYPGQTFGEYYTTPGMSGFGLDASQLTQAAAGMGQAPSRVPQLYQAAAGMGQAQLTQAAAGMGEYIVQGANGIGEYEQVTPQYTAPAQMDEGISPDLDSAERAMSIAEAAAGVGAFGDSDVPLQSTVYPTGVPEAIPDMPGGSRAGTFAGNNGVFGA